MGFDSDRFVVYPTAHHAESLDLSRFLARCDGSLVLSGADGQRVELGEEVCAAVRQVAAAFVAGKAAMVSPLGMMLTIQDAADFLEIRPATMLRLIDDGEIPARETPGNRCSRVALSDVVAYEERSQPIRRDVLVRMVQEGHAAGLYDAPGDGQDQAAAAERG